MARKTRAWGESPIRGDVPDALREALDGMDAAARRAAFRVLARAGTESGSDVPARAAGHLASAGRPIDAASVDVMARRIAQGEAPVDTPVPDLSVYDKFNRPGREGNGDMA